MSEMVPSSRTTSSNRSSHDRRSEPSVGGGATIMAVLHILHGQTSGYRMWLPVRPLCWCRSCPQDDRQTLADADADRGQAVAAAPGTQLVRQVRDHPGAGAA